ncbi:MAG: Smr/MutS family protein [Saprospiraceae bacterium]
MLFTIGTRVKFRFTEETGVVIGYLEDGMLQIRLDDDPEFEIPAFEDDILPYEELGPQQAATLYGAGLQKKVPQAPQRRVLTTQYHILKPKGLQLAFEPMPGRDDQISRYKVWLINDTQFEFLLEFDLYSSTRDILSADEKVQTASALELGDFLSDDLNDSPEAFVKIQRITTAGLEEALETTLKIRPKQFFNSLSTAPILGVPAYQFVVFNSFEKAADSEEGLADYTKSKKKSKRADSSKSRQYKPYDPEAFATFVPEIDLHIQKLINGYAKLDKGEIVRIQMLHFQKFLDRAIRLGVPRIFVIHGLGEGKLREAIAARLKEHPDVVKFKNEFHHKYGYGATEVYLQ